MPARILIAALTLAVAFPVAAAASPRTPPAIAAQEFNAAVSLGFYAPPPDAYMDADIAVDAGRCLQVTRARWLCPFHVHGHFTTYNDWAELERLRADCHAKAFVTRKSWRFSARLSDCLGSWLPQ